jgi:hypothetical protein
LTEIGTIEVVAYPPHQLTQHFWPMQFDPLAINGMFRQLPRAQEPRPPIEIRTLSDIKPPT